MAASSTSASSASSRSVTPDHYIYTMTDVARLEGSLNVRVRKLEEFPKIYDFVQRTFNPSGSQRGYLFYYTPGAKELSVAVYFRPESNDYFMHFDNIDEIFELFARNCPNFNMLLNNATVVFYQNSNLLIEEENYKGLVAELDAAKGTEKEAILLREADELEDSLLPLRKKEVKLKELVLRQSGTIPAYYERCGFDRSVDIRIPHRAALVNGLPTKYENIFWNLWDGKRKYDDLHLRFHSEDRSKLYFAAFNILGSTKQIGATIPPKDNEELDAVIYLAGRVQFVLDSCPLGLNVREKAGIIAYMFSRHREEGKF